MAFNYWQELEEGSIYHIYNKAISNLKLFRDEDDYYFFLAQFKKYFRSYFSIFSYCLIPNHFHFLVKVKTHEEILVSIQQENTKAAKKYLADKITVSLFLSDQFRRFFSSITIRYNKKYNHQGPILVKKLKKIKVSRAGTIQYLLCYVHHNPIHHGLATTYDKWPFSSFRAYLESGETSIAKDEMLDWLGGVQVFRKIHDNFREEHKVINLE